MQKISPFLWFDAQAEEAVAFYLSVFKDGKIHTTTRYPEDGPRPVGTVMTIAFELQGGAVRGDAEISRAQPRTIPPPPQQSRSTCIVSRLRYVILDRARHVPECRRNAPAHNFQKHFTRGACQPS